MINKLFTSSETQNIFKNLGKSINLQPYVLSKLAIALSVRKGSLEESDFKTNTEGLELSRQTIFGEHEMLFKALIANNEGHAVIDEEFFPILVKAHLDRGAKLLENEKKYSKDFYNHMCNLDNTI